MSPTSTGRRKGGQPGNTNRLRHGLYSRRLFPETEDLTSLTEAEALRLQRDLARRRLAHLFLQQERASLRDWLGYERAIFHYVQLIISLSQAHFRGAQLDAFMPDLADALTPLLPLHQTGAPGPREPLTSIRTSDEILQIPRELKPNPAFEPRVVPRCERSQDEPDE